MIGAAEQWSGDAVLIASGLGEDTGGGTYVLQDDAFVAVDRLSTTGLAVNLDGTRLARFPWSDGDPGAAGALMLYDPGGGLAYRRIDVLREPHGAVFHDGRLAVVSTLTNSILWLDERGAVLQRWSAPGDGDCWHLNSLLVHEGRLLASAFGRFATHRAWAQPGARTGRGIVFDVASGETVLDGLTCPHDPVYLDGSWLVGNSGTRELLRLGADGTTRARRPMGGWTRGFAYDDDRVYVGVSAHRIIDAHGTAEVAVLDRRSLTEVARWPLPCREVFALSWVPRSLADGLRAGFAPPVLASNGAATYAHDDHGSAQRILGEDDCRAPLTVTTLWPPRPEVGSALTLTYRLENHGGATLASAGAHPVRVGFAWSRPDGSEPVQEGRARLPTLVPPAGIAVGQLRVGTPHRPGRYRLHVSGVQEHVRWFSDVDAAWGWEAEIDVIDAIPAAIPCADACGA